MNCSLTPGCEAFIQIGLGFLFLYGMEVTLAFIAFIWLMWRKR